MLYYHNNYCETIFAYFATKLRWQKFNQSSSFFLFLLLLSSSSSSCSSSSSPSFSSSFFLLLLLLLSSSSSSFLFLLLLLSSSSSSCSSSSSPYFPLRCGKYFLGEMLRRYTEMKFSEYFYYITKNSYYIRYTYTSKRMQQTNVQTSWQLVPCLIFYDNAQVSNPSNQDTQAFVENKAPNTGGSNAVDNDVVENNTAAASSNNGVQLTVNQSHASPEAHHPPLHPEQISFSSSFLEQ